MCLMLPLLFLGVAVFLFWKNWSAINALIQELNGRQTGIFSGTFSFNGKNFGLYYAKPQTLTVYGEGDFKGRVLIRQKEKMDIFDIGRKLAFNDPSLSDLCYQGDDQVFVEKFMSSPAVVAAVKEILQVYSLIEIDSHRCSVRKYQVSIEMISDFKSKVENAAEKISIFMQYIP